MKNPFILLLASSLGAAAADPQSELGASFSWSTVDGGSYQLQQAADPEGPWGDLGSGVPGDGDSVTVYYPVEMGSGVFRLEATVPVGPASSDLPVDGGFELGSGTGFDHWSTAASQPPVRWSADSRSGGFCLRSALENQNAAAQEGLAWQVVGSEGGTITAGQSYEFSFWAKQISSGVSYVQQYELQWLNGSGGVLASTGLVNFSGGDGDWEQIALPGQVAPAGASDARITFRFVTGAIEGGSGEVLIDDVSLGEGSGGDPEMETQYSDVTPSPAFRVSWVGLSGVPYQPMVSSDLSNWSNYGEELTGNGGELEVIVPMDQARRFITIGFPDGTGDPDPDGDIIPLFDDQTIQMPDLQYETAEALVTRVGDRARDRHAREAQFNAYDHYLSWYWEDRTLDLTITDKVAKGGTEIIFEYTTQAPLGAAEFRAFFRGLGTVAEYHTNLLAELIAPNRYRAVIDNQMPDNRPLVVGDRVEIEISQFLAAPANGRSNYYGTAILYIVGQGIVPWEGKGALLDSFPLPEVAWLGGETTLPYQYSNEPEHRFKQTAGNIAPGSIQDFMLGRRLHHTDFGDGSHSEPGNPVFSAQENKLGNAFIARSCVECHVNNGRALPPLVGAPMLQSVVKVGADEAGSPHPQLGKVIQPRVLTGPPEGGVSIDSFSTTSGQYGDGTSYELRKPVYSFTGATPAFHSTRLAPPLVGLGLLEAVDEATIRALADPDDNDGDGISGRVSRVTDPETGEVRLGRFSAKAGQARLRHQVATALNTDMGVTTSVHPVLDDGSTDVIPELSDAELEQMTLYVAVLGVGARRDLQDADALAGEGLFSSIGCADCHTPSMTTGAHHPLAELRNQTIRPFTDLLLHDMGPGLADNMSEGSASPSEWRTPPLWNIGLTAGVSGGEAYLHDGRARTLEEAILWHGGEGESAKEAFRTLPSSDREKLIKFLKSL